MGIFSDILGGGASILGGMFGGPAGAAAGSLLGGLIGGKSGSGTQQGGTQTVNKDPWAPAQDWMKQNLATGQSLQNRYAQNPFNAQQMNAYGNLASGNDYLNRLTPGLLQQMSQPSGFNRNNPTARPNPLNFYAPETHPMAQGYGGQMQQSMPQGMQQPQFMLQADAKPQMDVQALIDDAFAKRPQYGRPYNNEGEPGGGG